MFDKNTYQEEKESGDNWQEHFEWSNKGWINKSIYSTSTMKYFLRPKAWRFFLRPTKHDALRFQKQIS